MTSIPTDFRKALLSKPLAKVQWDTLTPIARRDFISWIESAKQLETRKRRIDVACDKLISGKRRPCCYAVVPMGLYTALSKNPKAKATWKELTPDERRNFTDWVNAEKGTEAHERRIQKACTLLAQGKKHP